MWINERTLTNTPTQQGNNDGLSVHDSDLDLQDEDSGKVDLEDDHDRGIRIRIQSIDSIVYKPDKDEV